MKRTFLRVQVGLIAITLLTSTFVRAEYSVTVAPQGQKFSAAELDELFAPIALYPDPLLAQVVPAATFVEQLQDAQRVLNGSTDENLIAKQTWDVSVKSVAHYPQVLQMLAEKPDWTAAVGQAYVNQSTDVGKSIQRLRAQAKSAGSLVTTSQQEVISEGQVIKIVPAQPQLIYVPQYNPEVVYVNSGPSTGEMIASAAISFGAGLAIGAWLNNDWDWRGHGIYYHGWVGGGWIGRNRTFINVDVHRNVYINNRYTHINVNRNIVHRDISTYRVNLNRNAVVRTERTRNVTTRSTTVDRTNIGTKRTGVSTRASNTRATSSVSGRVSTTRTATGATDRATTTRASTRIQRGTNRTTTRTRTRVGRRGNNE